MHLHYSPFQFATAVEVSEGDVNAHKVVSVLKSLTKKDTSKTHNMGSTMSCEDASRIPGSPNAFISPNPVGAMKDIKMPMAPTGVVKMHETKYIQHYDATYRNRSRLGYGDRKE
tara:strand:- start:66 stop:407 length:342 start_codon:yes stop_codon:yes gene_type:complete